MNVKKRMAVVSNECVACGCCTKSCPLQAISVPRGICAEVDEKRCVGCGRCAWSCPAQAIVILVKEGLSIANETKTETLV